MSEHFVTDGFQRALFDSDDEPAPQPGAEGTQGIKDSHKGKRLNQRPPVRLAGSNQGQDIRVDQGLEEQSCASLGYCTNHYAQHNNGHAPLVLENVAENTPGCAWSRLVHAALAIVSFA